MILDFVLLWILIDTSSHSETDIVIIVTTCKTLNSFNDDHWVSFSQWDFRIVFNIKSNSTVPIPWSNPVPSNKFFFASLMIRDACGFCDNAMETVAKIHTSRQISIINHGRKYIYNRSYCFNLLLPENSITLSAEFFEFCASSFSLRLRLRCFVSWQYYQSLRYVSLGLSGFSWFCIQVSSNYFYININAKVIPLYFPVKSIPTNLILFQWKYYNCSIFYIY